MDKKSPSTDPQTPTSQDEKSQSRLVSGPTNDEKQQSPSHESNEGDQGRNKSPSSDNNNSGGENPATVEDSVNLEKRLKEISKESTFDFEDGELEYYLNEYAYFDDKKLKRVVTFETKLLDQSDRIILAVMSEGLGQALMKDRFYINDDHSSEAAEFRFDKEKGYYLYSDNPLSKLLKSSNKLRFLDSLNKKIFQK